MLLKCIYIFILSHIWRKDHQYVIFFLLLYMFKFLKIKRELKISSLSFVLKLFPPKTIWSPLVLNPGLNKQVWPLSKINFITLLISVIFLISFILSVLYYVVYSVLFGQFLNMWAFLLLFCRTFKCLLCLFLKHSNSSYVWYSQWASMRNIQGVIKKKNTVVTVYDKFQLVRCRQ